MVQPEVTSGELVDLLNTTLNLEERCEEAVIDVVMKNEDDNNFTARKSLKLIVWLLQSTLVANSNIYNQNLRKYFQQNGNFSLACSAELPFSTQQLLHKLGNINEN